MSFLRPLNLFTVPARFIGKCRGKNPYYWNDGIKYYGFTYYPRTPDFKDPPYEPSKLFRVQRIKPVKGTPYWERNILQELGLVGKSSDVAIVKNIPENNARLYKIKHLIKITPITFRTDFEGSQRNLPQRERRAYCGTPSRRRNASNYATVFKKDPKRMDGDTLRRQSRQKWLSGW